MGKLIKITAPVKARVEEIIVDESSLTVVPNKGMTVVGPVYSSKLPTSLRPFDTGSKSSLLLVSCSYLPA